jgi:hypothetical protein
MFHASLPLPLATIRYFSTNLKLGTTYSLATANRYIDGLIEVIIAVVFTVQAGPKRKKDGHEVPKRTNPLTFRPLPYL